MTPTLSTFDQFEWETNGLGVHKKHWGFRSQGSHKPWTWPKFTPCGGSKLVSIKNSVLPTTWTKYDWCIDRWNSCDIVCKKSLHTIHENHWWFICVFIDNVNKTKTWTKNTSILWIFSHMFGLPTGIFHRDMPLNQVHNSAVLVGSHCDEDALLADLTRSRPVWDDTFRFLFFCFKQISFQDYFDLPTKACFLFCCFCETISEGWHWVFKKTMQEAILIWQYLEVYIYINWLIN